MLAILFLFLFFTSFSSGYEIHVQYFRQPKEYAYFKLTNGNDTEWSTYVHMNREVNLREEEILELIKPLYDGPPKTLNFDSNSITRHIGTQFAYILTKYTVESMIFENLCSQMKPKFSKLLAHSEQKPKKIKFVIEHPSSSFTIPDDFQVQGIGSEEFRLDVLGKASLTTFNFDADAIQSTKKLVIKQSTDFPYIFDYSTLAKLRSPDVILEGPANLTKEHLHNLVQLWNLAKFRISKWEVQLKDEVETSTSVSDLFDGSKIKIQIENGWTTITRV
ncbi:unnamed protein product [Caenorhabditis angaria]|uniref:F-box associated domain-containing protein n=1 Tax=Caenorhabditis angaria TaxID=860376 RepID=A0A9P1IPG5_9PELO|nr:unnamed protein product [Caenorhabditis angaria]